MWDFKSGSSQVLASATSQVMALVVTDDGKWIAGGMKDGKLILWPVDNPAGQVLLFEEAGNQVVSLSYDPTGKYLASGDVNGNVKVWDVDQGTMLYNLRGHSARISSLEFSPDGKILASTSNDGTVRLWDAQDYNNQPVVLQDNAGYLFSVAFSPDGNYVVSGSMDANRLVMNPTKTSLMAVDICEYVERNFTQDEWATYIGEGIEYVETCGRKSSIGVKKE